MKIGIMLSANDPEEVWNAFRFGNVALKENQPMRILSVNKRLRQKMPKENVFPVQEQLQAFAASKGELLACGT